MYRGGESLKRHVGKTITKKCFDSKLVSNRLFHVSNRLIRAKSAQKRKKKIYLPQKQCVSKAKVGRICVIPSSGTRHGLQRKRQGAVNPVREKALDSYQVPIRARFNTYQ